MKHARNRTGLTLLESVISMGLLSAIMLPVAAVMSTSYQVYTSGVNHGTTAGVRASAQAVVCDKLRQAVSVTQLRSDRLDVRMQDGSTARLSRSGDQLRWRNTGPPEALAVGVSGLQFELAGVNSADPRVGTLVKMTVETNAGGRASVSQSLLWVRTLL